MGLLKANVSASDQIFIKKTPVFRIGYMVMMEFDKVGYATSIVFPSEEQARLYAQPGEDVVQVEIRLKQE